MFLGQDQSNAERGRARTIPDKGEGQYKSKAGTGYGCCEGNAGKIVKASQCRAGQGKAKK